MTTCTSCGSDVTGKKFCPQCGTPVQQTAAPAVNAAPMTACPRCGGEVKANAAFCMHCGSALHASQIAAPAQPTTRPCPSCHQAVPLENAFCIHCGQNMNAPVAASQPMVAAALIACPDCGRQNSPDMKFCGGCGSPLTAQQGQYPQQQYPQQYGQPQYPQQQQQYPQQYGQNIQGGYQQQPMVGQQPMTLRCPVCMAMAPIGTPGCPSCHTSLAGVVPTPAYMAPQGQQGGMFGGGGGVGNFLQGNNGKMAMGALGGAAAVLGGEMLLHNIENRNEDRGYGYDDDGYEHRHRREEEGPLGGLGDIANDIGLF